MSEEYFVPHKPQARLTPGEIAAGVTHEEKGTDPAAPLPATDLTALTADNASAHGGRQFEQQLHVETQEAAE